MPHATVTITLNASQDPSPSPASVYDGGTVTFVLGNGVSSAQVSFDNGNSPFDTVGILSVGTAGQQETPVFTGKYSYGVTVNGQKEGLRGEIDVVPDDREDGAP